MMLLPVSNFRQQQLADCLAACTAMVLTYLHLPFRYPRLLQTLETSEIGTPFSNIEHLVSQGQTVYRGEGDLDTLRAYLDTGLPVIVAVYTRDLLHWKTRQDLTEEEKLTDHAVVVIGIDDDAPESIIYVNDPDCEEAPQPVPEKAFMLAWSEHQYYYAVIQLDDSTS